MPLAQAINQIDEMDIGFYFTLRRHMASKKEKEDVVFIDEISY